MTMQQPITRVEKSTTAQGCNVRRVVHEDGQEEITLDTGAYPVLTLEAKPEATKVPGKVWP